jgi:MinD-like ATPase involved in chromosome partitioning or flagellar assembly
MSHSHIIVVHSPCGGVGKTLIALHLAYMYANKGLSTVLVDLSQYGALAPWLQIPRGITTGLTGMVTALEEGGVADGRIRSALVPGPGVKEKLQLVLSSGPAKMDRVQSSQAEKLLKHLAATNEVTVVDTGSDLSDRTLGALLAATRILITLQPSVVAGWQALELLDLLRSAYISHERLAAIFNRVQNGGRYGIAEYQQAVEIPLLGVVPESADLRRAPDEGGPPAVHRQTPGVRAIREIAHQLIPIFTPKELRRSWLLSR